MKIIYAGTPEFAVEPLKKIAENPCFEVVCVLTQEDKPQGRKAILTPPPVKVAAEQLNIPVIQPKKIREEVDRIKSFNAELMVTCAYGQILTQDVLDAFPKGVYNVHAGLLPAYRGASPIQSCILNGEKQTGISIMKTDIGLDTGDILRVDTLDILPNETYGQLSARLSLLGAESIVCALNSIKNGDVALTKQSVDGVNVVKKIHKNQAQICFEKNAEDIVNLVRAMNPAPIAYALYNGQKLNVWEAETAQLTLEETCLLQNAKIGEVIADKPKRGLLVKCIDGAVKLTKVQPAGGKAMAGSDFLNGRKIKKGDVFYVE